MDQLQRTVILHIGWHKTGTTAIQTFLHGHRQYLMENFGVLYPITGQKGAAHHRLSHSLLRAEAGDPGLWPELKTELGTTSGWKTAIISAESLHNATKEDVDLICSTVSGDWKTQVICYLRQPDEFLESSYAESVKKGLFVDSWTEFKNTRIKKGIPNYLDSLQKWKRVLGDGAVLIRPYSSTAWIEGDLFADFFSSIGRPEIKPSPALATSERINVSPNVNTLSVLREISKRLLASDVDYTGPFLKKHLCDPVLARLEQTTAKHSPARFFPVQERKELRASYQPIFHSLGLEFPPDAPPCSEYQNFADLPEYDELPTPDQAQILMTAVVELMRELAFVHRESIEQRKQQSPNSYPKDNLLRP